MRAGAHRAAHPLGGADGVDVWTAWVNNKLHVQQPAVATNRRHRGVPSREWLVRSAIGDRLGSVALLAIRPAVRGTMSAGKLPRW